MFRQLECVGATHMHTNAHTSVALNSKRKTTTDKRALRRVNTPSWYMSVTDGGESRGIMSPFVFHLSSRLLAR